MQDSKVLVVDGDRAARDALVTCLQFVGVQAHGAGCAVSAGSWMSKDDPDLLVLSEELAEGALAALLHRRGACDAPRIPILLLTRDGDAARLPANYPADETLRRSIPVSRMVERVESLIQQRRAREAVRLTFGMLTLDVLQGRLQTADRYMLLGPRESHLLAFFIGSPDRVYSRDQLLRRLWPANVRVEERTVDVHIRRLRLVLEQLGCADYIQTVRGSGYRMSLNLG